MKRNTLIIAAECPTQGCSNRVEVMAGDSMEASRYLLKQKADDAGWGPGVFGEWLCSQCLDALATAQVFGPVRIRM